MRTESDVSDRVRLASRWLAHTNGSCQYGNDIFQVIEIYTNGIPYTTP